MAGWLVYFKERFPLIPNLLVALGAAYSARYLTGVNSVAPLILTTVGCLLFSAELRLMDELKDYEKDKIAHPERPLPRGLLSVSQVHKAVNIVLLTMVIYSLLLFYVSTFQAAALFAIVTMYLYLMYKEFFVGEWLGQKALLYAVTHQVVVLGLAAYAISTFKAELALSEQSFGFGLMFLGAFFAYEICRKCDPKAHPILKQYLNLYGRTRVVVLVLMTLSITAYGSYLLGVFRYFLPMQLWVFISLSLLYVKPSAFKLIEGAAALSLLYHLWGIAILHWCGV